jgi:hypothetical protein
MNLHSDTSIGNVICSFDLNERKELTLQTIEVPPLQQEQIEESIASHFAMILVLKDKKFDSLNLENSDDLKITIEGIINTATAMQCPGLLSMLKNISMCNINFYADSLQCSHYAETVGLLSVSSLNIREQFSDVFRFINKNTTISGMSKTIKEVVTEKSKKNIVSVSLTEKICINSKAMNVCLVNCEEIYEEQTIEESLIMFHTTIAKFANTINAFLTISPANEQIKTIIIHAPDATHGSFMGILFTLLELNKIIEEKTKIDGESEFILYYNCKGEHVRLARMLVEIANVYQKINHKLCKVYYNMRRLLDKKEQEVLHTADKI